MRESPVSISRRFILKCIPTLYLAHLSGAKASQPKSALDIAAESPWMANQVAIDSDGTLFLGLPRYSSKFWTPSLARINSHGHVNPFPDNHWNNWKPGDDGKDAFVYLNSVHIFSDDSVWCVDQGCLSAGIFGDEYSRPKVGAQKIVQLDTKSGKVLRILRFDENILPPGSQLNDLRFHGSLIYISDSGLGGIIIHDLDTGETLRRLSGLPVVKASDKAPPAMLAHVKGGKTFHPPNSDMIEITADGKWLYWAAPTGPLYRVKTEYLRDPELTDAEIITHVESVYDNNFSGGCAMDSVGNIYFSETVTHNITVWSPGGKTAVLASDPRLIRPDGSIISSDRKLYVPVKQPVEIKTSTGHVEQKFYIYSVKLPESIEGIKLGDAVSGANV
jgi:sugar lactone lactonase YvrE